VILKILSSHQLGSGGEVNITIRHAPEHSVHDVRWLLGVPLGWLLGVPLGDQKIDVMMMIDRRQQMMQIRVKTDGMINCILCCHLYSN
jgi:hypothetical protein